MFFEIFVALLLATAVGALVVPFVVGFVKGPDARQPAPDPRSGPMWPLSRVASVYGRFLAFYVLAELAVMASWSKNARQLVCASTPYSTAGAGGSAVVAKPGAYLRSNGTVQVCAAHPSVGQWFLYVLIRLPDLLLWATILLVIWKLIRQAARTGPFTRQSALIMQSLGLVVIAGTAIAAAASALGADLLEQTLLISPTFAGGSVGLDVLVLEPLKALLPVPALAGAALLSFARITSLGAALDEEVKATV
jgi:hypothetical protein